MQKNYYKKLYVADAHADTATACGREVACNGQCHLDLKRTAEYLKLQVFAFFQKPEGKPWLEWQQICRHHDRFAAAVESFVGVDIVKRGSQLKATDCAWAVPALEAVDCFAWFDDKRYFLEELQRRYFKIIGLFWNNNNWAGSGADSNLPKAIDTGLTLGGRKFLELLAEYDFILDLAHASQRSFADACEVWQKPLMVSHCCCGELQPHIRNLTDRQLRTVGERQGYVGIAFYPYFLTGSAVATVDDIAEHICYAVKVAGVDTVGLGSDFDGIEVLPTGIDGSQSLYKLADSLQAKGLGQDDIEKIMGRNLQRFLLENID